MSETVYNEVIERMAVEPAFATRVQSGDAAALAGLDLTDAERSELFAMTADQEGRSQELKPRISKSAIIGGGGGAAHHAAAATTLLTPDHPAPHVDVAVDLGHSVDLTTPDPGTHIDPTTGHLVPNDPAHFHMGPDGKTTVPNDPSPPGGIGPAAGNPVLLVPAVQEITPPPGGLPAGTPDLHLGGVHAHGAGGGGGAGAPMLLPQTHVAETVLPGTLDPSGPGGTLPHTESLHTGGLVDAQVSPGLNNILQINPDNTPWDPHAGTHVAATNGAGYVAPPSVDETGQTQTGFYHHPDGSVEHDYSNGDHVTTESDGTVIVEHNNGETVTIHTDGTWTDMHPDGSATEYMKNGDVVTVAVDGSSTHAHSDGTTDYYDTSNHLTKTVFPDGTWMDSTYHIHTQWGTIQEPGSSDFTSTNPADGSSDTWPYGTFHKDAGGYDTSVNGYPAYPGHPVVVPYQNGFIVFDSADHATLYQSPGGETSYDPGQTASLINQLHNDQLAYCKQQALNESYSQGGGGGGW